jgi:hypothetical protein
MCHPDPEAEAEAGEAGSAEAEPPEVVAAVVVAAAAVVAAAVVEEEEEEEPAVAGAPGRARAAVQAAAWAPQDAKEAEDSLRCCHRRYPASAWDRGTKVLGRGPLARSDPA